jgi:hypothetical protein
MHENEKLDSTSSFGDNASTTYDSTHEVSHSDCGSCQVVAKPLNLKRLRRYSVD